MAAGVEVEMVVGSASKRATQPAGSDSGRSMSHTSLRMRLLTFWLALLW